VKIGFSRPSAGTFDDDELCDEYATTCMILRRQARCRPARNSNGMQVG
jgi:hypothetical protein